MPERWPDLLDVCRDLGARLDRPDLRDVRHELGRRQDQPAIRQVVSSGQLIREVSRPEISRNAAYWFDRNVRESLNHALEFARPRAITGQSKLVQALDQHEERESFLQWLESQNARWSDLREGAAERRADRSGAEPDPS